jgi:predicted ATPase
VVLTGGPGAGKTAVLETVRKRFCKHLAVLPESASILFGGGFPRRDSIAARAAAQRAISRVQVELERLTIEEQSYAVALCDRGTLDGLAYWPFERELFFSELGTSEQEQLSRYAAVIHLRSPGAKHGYNHQNPVRIETPAQAAEIDARIEAAWSAHPHRVFIDSSSDFLDKLIKAVDAIRAQIPDCCAAHLHGMSATHAG